MTTEYEAKKTEATTGCLIGKAHHAGNIIKIGIA